MPVMKCIYMERDDGVGIWHDPANEKQLKKAGWKNATPPKSKGSGEKDKK